MFVLRTTSRTNKQNGESMRVTKETKDKVQEYIDGLKSSNKEGGEFSLNDICKKLPNVDRWEIVSALRHSDDGIFVTGRRGKESRFLYGEAAKPMKKSIQYRQDYRAKHATNNGGSHASHETPGLLGSEKFALRLGLANGKTITVPVTSIEMVPV